jgi:polyhydroxybutyrate depolymerase
MIVTLVNGVCNTAITYTKGQLNDDTLTYGGLTRSFHVWVPAGHSDLSPLVFVFHGGGGSGAQIRAQTKFETVATNAIVVYPDGTGVIKTWNAGICCGSAMNNGVDDIGFITKMIDKISQSACVNTAQIYATGMSNGAMLTHRVGCDLSTKFAAIAGVAAQLQMTTCSSSNKIGVLMIHGSSDSNVPFNGGQGCGISDADYYPVSRGVNYWISHNDCACQTFNSSCAHFNISISTPHASCTEYCYDSVQKVQTCFGNWTHTWPRTDYSDQSPAAGCPNPFGPSDFLATNVVWDFFQQHSLQTPSPTNLPTTISPTTKASEAIVTIATSLIIRMLLTTLVMLYCFI